jgi:integrase
MTLREAIERYITSRDSTLSPSTIRGYRIIQGNRFVGVMDTRVACIKDWQRICNDESKLYAPKTLKNSWLFVVSVLRYNKFAVPEVTLPQVPANEHPYLTPDQIKIFVKAIKGDIAETAALLALHSLRLSEIYALDWKRSINLDKKLIIVEGAVVPNAENKLTEKPTNKNKTSRRVVPIMMTRLCDLLSDAPEKTGKVVSIAHATFFKHIKTVCVKNNLPQIGIHGLRHSFASLAYQLRVPEQIAMQIGGWSDVNTMRKIYVHISQKDVAESVNMLTGFFENANENANETKRV